MCYSLWYKNIFLPVSEKIVIVYLQFPKQTKALHETVLLLIASDLKYMYLKRLTQNSASEGIRKLVTFHQI